MVSRLITSLLDLCALSIAGFFLPFLGIPFKNGRAKTLGNISGGNIYQIRNIREKKPAQNSGLTKVGLFLGEGRPSL